MNANRIIAYLDSIEDGETKVLQMAHSIHTVHRTGRTYLWGHSFCMRFDNYRISNGEIILSYKAQKIALIDRDTIRRTEFLSPFDLTEGS